jgi:hypothetical protein
MAQAAAMAKLDDMLLDRSGRIASSQLPLANRSGGHFVSLHHMEIIIGCFTREIRR